MLLENGQHASTVQDQKGDKASGEAHYDDQAGLPQPEEVMARVPETRTKEETSSSSMKSSSFMDGLKADWNKMFGNKTNKSTSDQGSLVESENQDETDGDKERSAREQRLDAQLPGVLGEPRQDGEIVDVQAGEVKEEPIESTVPSTATAGGRKNLEIKIVREIVRTLGGGESCLMI
jgi:hypothetical protein